MLMMRRPRAALVAAITAHDHLSKSGSLVALLDARVAAARPLTVGDHAKSRLTGTVEEPLVSYGAHDDILGAYFMDPPGAPQAALAVFRLFAYQSTPTPTTAAAAARTMGFDHIEASCTSGVTGTGVTLAVPPPPPVTLLPFLSTL